MQVVGTEHAIPKAAGAKQARTTVRTAVAGVGGYAGGELARLLLAHPRLSETKPLFLGRVADNAAGGRVPLEQIQPQLALGAGEKLPEVRAFSWELVRFFFQAEDGIRDGRVTGVQTCALPICRLLTGAVGDVAGWRWALASIGVVGVGCAVLVRVLLPASRSFVPAPARLDHLVGMTQIGRASCRERV